MPLEYLSGNELLKYPFKDETNMYSSTGVFMPNGVFADLLVGFNRGDLNYASLTGVRRVGTNGEIKIAFYDKDNTFVDYETYVVDLTSVIRHKLIAISSNPLSVRIIPGADFLTFFNSLTSTWQEYACVLDEFALTQHVPRVTSVTFVNNTEDGKVMEAYLYGDELTDLEMKMSGGSNVDLSYETNKMVLSVFPGAGTGLYDACGTDRVIKTINAVPGDPFYRNFTILTDGCYSVRRGFGTTPDFGLTFENTCKPKCTAEQLAAFAHYLNRVKDGMITISNYAADIYGQITTAIDTYTNVTLPASKQPVIKSSITSYDNGYGTLYHSIVVGVFNRHDNEAVTMNVSVSGGTVVESHYKSGDTTFDLGAARTYTGSLPCLDQGRVEFVFKGLPLTVTASAGTTSYSKEYT